MAMDENPQLSNLLKWGIENSTSQANANDPASANLRARGPDSAALASLFGAPSDAEMMQRAMTALQSPDVALDQKLIAFDNFEQLIESIDNANNLGPLALWTPLINLLAHEEAEMRMMAAWCVGTAVQNNPAAQAKLLELGAITNLVSLWRKEKDSKDDVAVRKKVAYAVSSEVRNYQDGMNKVLEEFGSKEAIDAGDMEAVDVFIAKLRQGEDV